MYSAVCLYWRYQPSLPLNWTVSEREGFCGQNLIIVQMSHDIYIEKVPNTSEPINPDTSRRWRRRAIFWARTHKAVMIVPCMKPLRRAAVQLSSGNQLVSLKPTCCDTLHKRLSCSEGTGEAQGYAISRPPWFQLPERLTKFDNNISFHSCEAGP